MRNALALAACLLIAACTTTNAKLATAIEKPRPDATVAVAQPDVQLSLLGVSGLAESRADWSNAARDNISGELKKALDAKGLKYTSIDPSGSMAGRTGQLLRLNAAVGQSIQLFNYGVINLPTHKDNFDWTLGDGAHDLAVAYNADYALFIGARGSYSSDTRKLAWLGAAAFGVSLPMGGQYLYASLVDLKTGRILWYNEAVAGPNADMRSVEGAHSLVVDVLKTAPF
jgi:hypothetical protein